MTDVGELAQISAAIHDEYFDLDSAVHDRDSDEFRLPIYPGRRKRWLFIETLRAPTDPLPPPLGQLVIRNVLDVAINDDAGIGWFDVGALTYDADSEELRLVSNVPLEIRLHVRGLDVAFARQ